jgi:hypothetical protein
MVVDYNWSLHAGFGWFIPQNQHRAGQPWRPSYDEVGVEEVARFAVGFPQNYQVPWLSHKVKNEGSAGGDGIRACREASRRGTRDVIARLASDGSKTAVGMCSPNGNIHFLTKVPLGGVYLLYG